MFNKSRILPPLPSSWSALTWLQLTQMWTIKIRYAGHPDAARVAALLELSGIDSAAVAEGGMNTVTGELIYVLRHEWHTTPRELSYYAQHAIPWFDWPYGDPGEKEEHDEKGNITHERREPVMGYVSNMRDAMVLPKEELTVKGWRCRHYKLPDAACMNITWQQYRTLNNIIPDLFAENTQKEDQLMLQARFLAHLLVPRSLALFDTTGGSIKLRPHYTYEYNADRAERLISFWKRQLINLPTLFHVCFQCFQTALTYYSVEFPHLFAPGKSDVHGSALANEAGTLNSIMKYQGYASPQAVYDESIIPILSVLNAMAKEAEEMAKMNAKIKK